MFITYEKRSIGRCTEVSRQKYNEDKESCERLVYVLVLSMPEVQKKVERFMVELCKSKYNSVAHGRIKNP